MFQKNVQQIIALILNANQIIAEIQRALENIAVCEDLHLKKCPYLQIDHSHTSWLDQKR